MKCHRLYIKLEYYFFSIIVFRATFCCLFASTNQSKGTILFFLLFFETKAVSEMASVTTVTIEQHNTISLNTDKLTHTGDIYNRYIYIIILMHCSVIFMHIILSNMIFKRDMPFLRHDNKKKCLRKLFCFYL